MQLFAVKKKHYIFAVCLRQKLKKTELNKCMRISELNTGNSVMLKVTGCKNIRTIISSLRLQISFTDHLKRLRI